MLAQTRSLDVTDRNHFLGYASTAMGSVSVDLIRKSQAERRGGGWLDLTVNTGFAISRPRRLPTMRCFAGPNDGEIAECLGVTLRTVDRAREKARVFRYTMLKA